MCARLRKRMPESACDYRFSGGDTATYSNGSVSSSGFWSKHRDDVSCNQLQKFWSELSPQARQELLRIDKQTLFEATRKNMYCSRCNGLLLEGFLQIVMYGKSLQQEGIIGQVPCSRHGTSKDQTIEDACLMAGCNDDFQDPSVHPWGGLTANRDGTLTLLDCYLYSKSLKGLQNVFGSARARERERELLYPDACGGGGRGWISQGMVGYGRGHGTRETCALHTARLSVDTLVDFWSALGEETRHSLLKMKEDDFMERLMYRFDSKRFCRDCRKNVIREFKELKELKRMKREARCTSWYCVADTSIQYEVSLDAIQVDWHQNYGNSPENKMYHHYEWAVGTAEGKSDILAFENVGLNSRVRVSGLNLTGLSPCYITLRAWKMDGRYNELTVKAHALSGQQCVHCRLVVGDGFVSITRGESIRRFFEHAEEAEEEEDDDSMDKDGNELDGECSRPQKHAKSPELAREFLLDAATVIFKEQVEKAFREGTARQNAHSIFVSLALKLLEDRVLVACKDIITLERQYKLLEEEEKEKREEEERKERRRAKEKEKKLRRKERLRNKEKEKEREKKCPQSDQTNTVLNGHEEQLTTSIEEESNLTNNLESVCNGGDLALSVAVPEDHVQYLNHDENSSMESGHGKDNNIMYVSDRSKHPRRKPKFWKDYQPDQLTKWADRRRFAVVSESGGIVSKLESRFHGGGFDTSSRNSNFNGVNKPQRSNNLRAHVRSNGSRYVERLHCSHNRMNGRYDPHACSCYHHNDYRLKISKPEPDTDVSKPYYSGNKYNNQTEYVHENCGRPKSKTVAGNTTTKKAWEPMETQKRYAPRSNSDSDVINRATSFKAKPVEPTKPIGSSNLTTSVEPNHEDNDLKESKSSPSIHQTENEVDLSGTTDLSLSSNSNSDSCSSCPSEGDGNTSFSSNTPNPESSSTSDSEDTSQHSEGLKETSLCLDNGVQITKENETPKSQNYENGKKNDVTDSHSQGNNVIPSPLQAQGIQFPLFQAPSMGYYHQASVPWITAPANGLMPLPHPDPNRYLFPSPFGYGLNGNSHYLPYGVGSLQPLTPPLVQSGHHLPIYQPSPQINGINLTEQSNVPSPQKGEQNGKTSKQHPLGPAPIGQGQYGRSDKIQKANTGFSLFHFGGPVALTNGFKSDTVAISPKEEIAMTLSSNDSGGSVEAAGDCGKKDGIEEYNLFATSNGIRFSFF